MQDFRKLVVWQRAQALAVAVYAATERVGNRAAPGLRSQLRRSASAIAANIAEGAGVDSSRQFARYLQIAIGSASEAESHLDLATRLRALPAESISPLVEETQAIRRMLSVLRQRVLERATLADAASKQGARARPMTPSRTVEPP